MRDRLIELLNYTPCKAECCSALDGGRCGDLDKLDRCQIEAIADHLLANGVIVPPCKVGDVVYKVTYPYRAEPKVTEFVVNGFDCYRNAKKKMKINIHLALRENRKLKHTAKLENVYIDREEAEQALKGGAE